MAGRSEMPFSHDCHNQLSLGKSIDDALRLGCRTAGYRQSPGLLCGRNQGVIGAAVVTPVSIFIGPLRHLHGINRIVRKGRHYDCHAGRPAAVAANVVSSVGLARPGDTEIDVSGCPDLLPPLAVMAAARSGTTRFVNAARLRMKESDRLSTTAALLTALGGRAEEGPDFLTVHGGTLTGGMVDCANDHRIAMAAAIAATACTGPVTVLGAQCVQKSYPDFWEVYKNLGGDIHVL